MDLQELVTRGRLLMADAPSRLRVFELANGKRTASDIAKRLGRPPNGVRNDLRVLQNAELLRPKTDLNGVVLKRDGSLIYEKVPLARTVKTALFKGTAPRPNAGEPPAAKQARRRARSKALSIPGDADILSICSDGEDQIYEFKSQGTEARKIAKEIAGFLTTRDGGLIFYGVEDDGTIQGSDLARSTLDQAVQNAVRNSISPAAHVSLHSVKVLGSEIIVIQIPPWNRRDVYQYEGRVLTRKGTNVFQVTAEEARRLHRGEYID